MELTELLAFATKYKALELRLVPGSPPLLKVAGSSEPARINLPPLKQQDVDDMVKPLLDAKAQEALRFGGKCEGSHEVKGLGTFGYRIAPGEVVIAIPPPPPAKPGFLGKLFGG